ncbi:hypothetical protein BS78_07G035100 [Paspalum vaginatum]|nr:hypothetical protein BS78_07G035100 [Paspalum vaginatum]
MARSAHSPLPRRRRGAVAAPPVARPAFPSASSPSRCGRCTRSPGVCLVCAFEALDVVRSKGEGWPWKQQVVGEDSRRRRRGLTSPVVLACPELDQSPAD